MIVTYKYIPETKGKSLEEIEAVLESIVFKTCFNDYHPLFI